MKLGSITTMSMFFFFTASTLATPLAELEARQSCPKPLDPHGECSKWQDEMEACYFGEPGVNAGLILNAGNGAVTVKSRCATAVAMWFGLDCLGWECLKHDLRTTCTGGLGPKRTLECHKKALSNCGIIIRN
ncbi:hypothetical protein BGX38DRAFT_1264977 [Terfezia claveryi]|nr:hypothetical protein BGX38DRAFT_1280699 [Terfezia claveryi]KAF8458670.1 hypothetical protein BGX38DRAFT_1264977 [Terfezia claveryi]